MNYKLTILPGDGIGREVMAEVVKLIGWINQNTKTKIDHTMGLVGGCSIDKHGVPLTEDTVQQCKNSDAVLLGAVGGPQWAGVDYNIRPEMGLMGLRKNLGLFANLRPALVFDALIDSSTLKPDVIRGLDILIVRELTGGVYFGEPRGIHALPNGERRGINTQVYDTHEIIRIGRIAFNLARKRGNKVTSCEKSNVMESGKLWREEMTKLRREEFSDVTLEHIYADNCAMQLLRNPRQFDVIVTDNLFGDILSDEAAMLAGSLGMLPSASLGAPGTPGLYEPIHGSAPDIAGQGKANPLAAILSFAMGLRYSLDEAALAGRIETAVQAVLNDGIRTPDIAAAGMPSVGTAAMGDAVIRALS